MKRIILFLVGLFLLFSQPYCLAKEDKANILLLIAEQNIGGPQRAWWASEIDLSTVEAELSKVLIYNNFSILTPSQVKRVLRRNRAFRRIDLLDEESVRLGGLSNADYVVLGKAVASAGTYVPHSNMRSCFAHITAKLIRVSDGEVIAYLSSKATSPHLDAIAGVQEALAKAAEDMAMKIVNTLNEYGGK